eukprot:g34532.t1
MKFGTRLKLFIQTEWGDVYISYKKLKKLIEEDEDAERELTLEEAATKCKLFLKLLEADLNSLCSLMCVSQLFLKLLEADLNKVETFIKNRLQELLERLNSLKADENLDSRESVTEYHDYHHSYHEEDDEDHVDLSVPQHLDHKGELTPLLNQKETNEIWQKRQKKREKGLLRLLEDVLLTQVYIDINRQAIVKILKKYDKHSPKGADKLQKSCISKWLNYESTIYTASSQVRELVPRIEEEFTKVCLLQGIEIENALATIAKCKIAAVDPTKTLMPPFILKWRYLLLATTAATVVMALPMFHHLPSAQKCLALLTWITVIWISEAVPFFVGGMSMMLLAIVGRLILDDDLKALNARDASKVVFSCFFNDTVFLILGGFSLAAAFAKCQFERNIADLIHRLCGHSPHLFLLAIMFLGIFLSMWISNVTAPVLITSFLTPLVRDLPTHSSFARCLILGLAVSCNIGGMISPISSPQNAVALGYLEYHLPHYSINFLQWILVTVPFCSLLVVLSWLYLITVIPPRDLGHVPKIPYKRIDITLHHYMVLVVSGLTILLWCTQNKHEVQHIFGGMGTIAILPFILLYGSGVLTNDDLHGFAWNMIMLVGSGNVLGKVISSSQLLQLIVDSVAPFLSAQTPWVASCCVLVMVFLVSTFVSHTVSAMILTPVIASLGLRLGNLHPMLMTSSLMMSGTMSLPMSSFPNVNSLLVLDDHGKPYIHPIDLLKHGSVISVGVLIALCTVGYGMVVFEGKLQQTP